jgi:Cu(I)/Ag(I) efflux system membrane fusion protein
MKTINAIMLGGIVGVVLTVGFYAFVKPTTEHSAQQEKQPIYWVAPMDPDFRRDQPGQSPMGMDLVPVYADPLNEKEPGIVSISPNVVNNLGVRTAKAKMATLHVPINTVGYVQYNENNLVHVHPRVDGWIETLYAKTAGDQVKKGEPLYAIYSPELVNAQEEYLLATKRKNQTLITAAQSRLAALQMPANSIEALKNSKTVQQTIVFNAPQSGVIDNLNIREGFFVKPGTTLMSIGALDNVWVEAEIFERQAAQVQIGQSVNMTLGFVPGKVWQGKVDYVYPTLNPETRTVRVRLVFTNKDRLLKPSMFAEVTIHTDLSEQSVLVPRESVIRTGKKNRVVLVVGQGQYKSIDVTLGQVTSEFAQILSGIEAGDEVVTSAQFLLDSESSIDSDFKRMAHSNQQNTVKKIWGTAITEGLINSLNTESRIGNISRGPIEKWSRGPATLDYAFSDDVDLSPLQAGTTLLFEFEVHDEQFLITSYDIISDGIIDPHTHSVTSGHKND